MSSLERTFAATRVAPGRGMQGRAAAGVCVIVSTRFSMWFIASVDTFGRAMMAGRLGTRMAGRAPRSAW